MATDFDVTKTLKAQAEIARTADLRSAQETAAAVGGAGEPSVRLSPVNVSAAYSYLSALTKEQGELSQELSSAQSVLQRYVATLAQDPERAVNASPAPKDKPLLSLVGMVVSKDAELQEQIAGDLTGRTHVVRTAEAVDELKSYCDTLPRVFQESNEPGRALMRYMCELVVNLTTSDNISPATSRLLARENIFAPDGVLTPRGAKTLSTLLTATVDFIRANQPDVIASLGRNAGRIIAPNAQEAEIGEFIRTAIEGMPADDDTYLNIFKNGPEFIEDETAERIAERVSNLINKAAGIAREAHLIGEGAEKAPQNIRNLAGREQEISRESAQAKAAALAYEEECNRQVEKLYQSLENEKSSRVANQAQATTDKHGVNASTENTSGMATSKVVSPLEFDADGNLKTSSSRAESAALGLSGDKVINMVATKALTEAIDAKSTPATENVNLNNAPNSSNASGGQGSDAARAPRPEIDLISEFENFSLPDNGAKTGAPLTSGEAARINSILSDAVARAEQSNLFGENGSQAVKPIIDEAVAQVIRGEAPVSPNVAPNTLQDNLDSSLELDNETSQRPSEVAAQVAKNVAQNLAKEAANVLEGGEELRPTTSIDPEENRNQALASEMADIELESERLRNDMPFTGQEAKPQGTSASESTIVSSPVTEARATVDDASSTPTVNTASSVTYNDAVDSNAVAAENQGKADKLPNTTSTQTLNTVLSTAEDALEDGLNDGFKDAGKQAQLASSQLASSMDALKPQIGSLTQAEELVDDDLWAPIVGKSIAGIEAEQAQGTMPIDDGAETADEALFTSNVKAEAPTINDENSVAPNISQGVLPDALGVANGLASTIEATSMNTKLDEAPQTSAIQSSATQSSASAQVLKSAEESLLSGLNSATSPASSASASSLASASMEGNLSQAPSMPSAEANFDGVSDEALVDASKTNPESPKTLGAGSEATSSWLSGIRRPNATSDAASTSTNTSATISTSNVNGTTDKTATVSDLPHLELEALPDDELSAPGVVKLQDGLDDTGENLGRENGAGRISAVLNRRYGAASALTPEYSSSDNDNVPLQDSTSKVEASSTQATASTSTTENEPAQAHGFFGRLAGMFKRGQVETTDTVATDTAGKTQSSLDDKVLMQPEKAVSLTMDDMVSQLKTLINNPQVAPEVSKMASSIHQALTNPLGDLQAVSAWLGLVSAPLNASGPRAAAMQQWALMLLSIRFRQLGKSIDKFTKSDAFNKMLAKVDVGASEKWPQSMLDETMGQIERLQTLSSAGQELGMPSFIPLPPSYPNGREGGLNVEKGCTPEGLPEWKLSFFFELPDLGPLQVKTSISGNDVKLSFVAEKQQALQKIVETAPVLRERLDECGFKVSKMSPRLGRVYPPGQAAPAVEPVNVAPRHDGLSLNI